MTISPVSDWQENWRNGNANAEIIDVEFAE